MHPIWGKICPGIWKKTGRSRSPDYQRSGKRSGRTWTERCAAGEWAHICSVGQWCGCLLSKRTYGIISGYFGSGGRDPFGTFARYSSASAAFSKTKPDHQRLVGCGACDGGKGAQRFFDHSGSGIGAGEGCVCASGTGQQQSEPGMQSSDRTGGRDFTESGRIIKRTADRI